MNNLGTHNNHASWSERQLYDNAPRRLAGTDLVRVAKHYTNEELVKQAQKYNKEVIKSNNFTHFLTGACLDSALANGQEPDHFREAFNAERLRNLAARGNVSKKTLSYLRGHKCVMPANVFTLSANPDLLELERARAAYAEKKAAGFMYPSEYWIKMEQACRGMNSAQSGMMGFTNIIAMNSHISKARTIGPTLADIVQNAATNTNTVQAGPTAALSTGTQAISAPHTTTVNSTATSQTSTSVHNSVPLHITSTGHTTAPHSTPSPVHTPTPTVNASHDDNGESTLRTTLSCFIRSIERRPDLLNLTTFSDLVTSSPDSNETAKALSTYQRLIRDLDLSAYDNKQVAQYVGYIVSEWLGKRTGDSMTILETMVVELGRIDEGIVEMIEDQGKYRYGVDEDELEDE